MICNALYMTPIIPWVVHHYYQYVLVAVLPVNMVMKFDPNSNYYCISKHFLTGKISSAPFV